MQNQKDLIFHEADVIDRYVGLLQEEALLKLLWEQRIAAIATDSPSIEAVPPNPAGEGTKGLSMRQSLLGGFGCPIGELWDLDALSAACERNERWSFFFTSAPLRVKGNVASPPNAMAIF
ncbi:hypothetical protein BT69DRAFT_1275706 [Atractiella rhizophila]|nr:hypothetical protein BT69DRAFT_1275706 [Atractiella rhizophila]